MGGPYLCRLLPLRSPSASSIPDCLTSLSAGWWRAVGMGGLAGVKGERKHKPAAATLSASATPGPYSTHTLPCGFVATTGSQMQLLLSHILWDRALKASTSIFAWVKLQWGKKPSEETLELIGLLFDQTVGETEQLSTTRRQQRNKKNPTWAYILASMPVWKNWNMDTHIHHEASSHCNLAHGSD